MGDENLPRDVQLILDAFVDRAHRNHFVTYDDLNEILNSREFSNHEVEQILAYLATREVVIVDSEN